MFPNPRKILEFRLEKNRRADEIRNEKLNLKRQKECHELQEIRKLNNALLKYKEVEENYYKQILKRTKIKKSKSFHDASIQTQKPVYHQRHKLIQAEIQVQTTEVPLPEYLPAEVFVRDPNHYPPILHKKSKSGVMFIHLVGYSPKSKKQYKEETISNESSQSPIRESSNMSRIENYSFDSSVKKLKPCCSVRDEVAIISSKLNPYFYSFRDIEIQK